MRLLFQMIRQLVEQRVELAPETRELPWKCVSAFCFQRFIVPAVVYPHSFDICAGKQSRASLYIFLTDLTSRITLPVRLSQSHINRESHPEPESGSSECSEYFTIFTISTIS
jgi:hypothetical protein